jgi:hypothetical protein
MLLEICAELDMCMHTEIKLAGRIAMGLLLIPLAVLPVAADGLVIPPRDYQGSLEERAQEAIIIFHGSSEPGKATEELILKIQVHGDAPNFAWVVPFPNEPQIAKEDAALFSELFAYVEARSYATRKKGKSDGALSAAANEEVEKQVEVLSHQTVGEFEITVVREKDAGGLNPWLEQNGYQTLQNAEQTLAFYRERDYVFACIKVSSEVLESERSVDSHPLRFTFATGGRDGIYFPMKMTGLQSDPFDVNLYVFYRAWINDKLSPFGYEHRGFRRRYRDWDSAECVPNGGKSYSLPGEDPFLGSFDHLLPTVTKLFQKLHPGAKYYLTNIQARGLKPEDVRQWRDDLWLFPYYTNRGMVPYDARPDGPAHAAYPDVAVSSQPTQRKRDQDSPVLTARSVSMAGIVILAIGIVAFSAKRRFADSH